MGSKYFFGDNFWSAEVRIPFPSLNITPDVSDTWGLNLCRNERYTGELTAWSPTYGSFHTPIRFGDLTGLKVDFSKCCYSVGVPSDVDCMLGENTLKVSIKNETGKDGKVRANLDVILVGGERIFSSQQDIRLKEGEEKNITLKYNFKKMGYYRLRFSLSDAKTKRMVYSYDFPVVEIGSPICVKSKKLYYKQDEKKASYDISFNLRDEDLKKMHFVLKVKPVEDDKIVYTKKIESPSAAALDIDISNLPIGDYVVFVSLFKGNRLISSDRTFIHIYKEGKKFVKKEFNLYSEENQRKRLINIKEANESIRGYLNKIHVKNYEPALFMGSFDFSGSYKEQEEGIKNIGKRGLGAAVLFHVHEGFGNPFGEHHGNTYSEELASNFKKFIELVHSYGMRTDWYASPGYCERQHKDYKEKWSKKAGACRGTIKTGANKGFHYVYQKCCPGSPGWRNYLLSNLEKLLKEKEYDIDAVYLDSGFSTTTQCLNPDTHIHNRWQSLEERWDSYLDLLSQLYNLAKKYDKEVILHDFNIYRPEFKNPIGKYCDRILAGECTYSYEMWHQFYRHLPYTTFLIWTYGVPPEDPYGPKPFAYSIPYLQFPTCEAKELWYHYLSIYRDMVKQDTTAFIEVKESNFVSNKLSPDVIYSIFANDELYMAVANYAYKEERIKFTSFFRDMETGKISKSFRLSPESLLLLKKE